MGFGSKTGHRLIVAAVLGAVAGGLCAWLGPVRLAPLVGWIALCLVFLVWTWLLIGRMDGGETHDHAEPEDASRSTSDTVVLLGAVASLAGVGLLVVGGKNESQSAALVDGLVALAAVAASWFTIHTLYSLRYARIFYDDADEKPVDFNEDDGYQPRYSDFAYLAFTLGMTYQVSDTSLSTPQMRRAALGQGLLSYLFGTVIVASTINLLISLAGGGG